MFISVIVCTYNRSEILKNCILSIVDNKFSRDNYEIVIVDNNSKDDTNVICNELMSIYTNIKYVLENNIGLSYARNTGIVSSSGEIIVFLDDDTIVYKNYLDIVYEYFKENSHVVFAGGKIIPVWNIEKPKWFNKTFASIIGETTYGNRDRKMITPEMPLGGNMIIKRSIFNEVGVFDTTLGMMGDKVKLGEESDLNNRILKRGYESYYISKAKVNHIVHQNKINKEYMENRLVEEGLCLAEMNLKEESVVKCKVLLIRRLCILCVRDIPKCIILIGFKNKRFAAKCKMKRSIMYINTMIKKSNN